MFLLLQFCYLFISFLSFIIFHLYSSLSSHCRFSVVNVLLLFNTSLIMLAPESPILLSTQFLLYIPLFFFFILPFSSLLRSSLVHGAIQITSQSLFSICSVMSVHIQDVMNSVLNIITLNIFHFTNSLLPSFHFLFHLHHSPKETRQQHFLLH